MGLLERGQRALVRRQQQAASPRGPVYYRRYSGGELVAEADLTGIAWVGRTAFRRTAGADADGPAIVWGDRDYLIPAEGFEGFDPAKPLRGDRVVELVGDAEVVYEVISPFDEPEARPSDPGETVWRVHVKKVG